MEEKTSDEIAAIFSAAGDSVTVIGTAQLSDETDDDFKDKIQRNVEHLEIIKAYKKLDETTSPPLFSNMIPNFKKSSCVVSTQQ